MMYAGVKHVRVLNGGIHSWQRAGFELTKQSTAPEPVSEFGVTIPARPEVFVDLLEAKKLLAAMDGELVSVRSWNEFIGEVSGYNYIDKKGRIPGAVFGNCGSDAYHMESYRNKDHTTRETTKSRPSEKSRASSRTNTSPSTVGRAGVRAKRFSTPGSWVGRRRLSILNMSRSTMNETIGSKCISGP
ncbi:MAG: hypothetical protein J7M25_04240 [Deltaproteobacteria bacterium]|nr:hypothetical protein [Deltaproteobacteria bacterium]